MSGAGAPAVLPQISFGNLLAVLVTIVLSVGSAWLDLSKRMVSLEERDRAIEQQLSVYAQDHDRLVVAMEQLRALAKNLEFYTSTLPYYGGGKIDGK